MKKYNYTDWGYKSAKVILPIVFSMLIEPKSIIDLGCGRGSWLVVAKELLGKDITIIGFDNYVKSEDSYLNKTEFFTNDITTKDLNQTLGKVDLLISLEVAEHIEKGIREDQYFENMINMSDNILFSCAVPGQGGEHHINEQWSDYWVEKFRNEGYTCIDCIREKVWNREDVAICYKNNTLFFTKDPEIGKLELTYPFRSIIHPELYALKVNRFYNGKIA